MAYDQNLLSDCCKEMEKKWDEIIDKAKYLQSGQATIEPKTITANGTYDAADDGAQGYNPVVVQVPENVPAVVNPLTVTENGTFTPPAGVDGYAPVTVNVPDVPAVVNPLTVTENGTFTPPAGVDGYAPVTVNVPDVPAVVNPLTVTENGTFTPPAGVDGYAPVNVNVTPKLEELIASVNGDYTPSTGKDGFSKVYVKTPQTFRSAWTSNIELFGDRTGASFSGDDYTFVNNVYFSLKSVEIPIANYLGDGTAGTIKEPLGVIFTAVFVGALNSRATVGLTGNYTGIYLPNVQFNWNITGTGAQFTGTYTETFQLPYNVLAGTKQVLTGDGISNYFSQSIKVFTDEDRALLRNRPYDTSILATMVDKDYKTDFSGGTYSMVFDRIFVRIFPRIFGLV